MHVIIDMDYVYRKQHTNPELTLILTVVFIIILIACYAQIFITLFKYINEEAYNTTDNTTMGMYIFLSFTYLSSSFIIVSLLLIALCNKIREMCKSKLE